MGVKRQTGYTESTVWFVCFSIYLCLWIRCLSRVQIWVLRDLLNNILNTIDEIISQLSQKDILVL